MSSQIPGTNVPPITFPGISSGIDFTSIIQKLTSLTTIQNVSLNAQIATLNSANAELIKINGLLSSVQTALGGLSDPHLFSAFTATSSNTAIATAASTGGSSNPLAGTYTILNTQLATSSTVVGNVAAGHSIKDLVGGVPSDTVPLANSYAAVTPSNGPSGQGSITVDGVTVKYNVNIDSLQTVLSKINTAVNPVDATFNASVNAAGVVTFQSTAKPISIGSATDQGNLLAVLKLSNAQVNNTATSGIITGTSNVGGINQTAALNGTNAANFVTPVTSGVVTINGVAIKVDATGDNVASILAKINASAAGVIATYNSDANQITLTSKTTGPQNIVVGAASDTSNFLSAAGLTNASGATSTTGKQASVTVQSPSGTSQTFFSNSNQVTNAIPGISINVLGSTASSFTINVGQDTTQLVTAVNGFVSSYNATINEINTASAPPLVPGTQPGASLPANAQTPIGGGVLFDNADVASLKDRLTNLVSGFFGSNSGFNSLASIGLQLTSSFSILTSTNNGSQNGGTAATGTQPDSVVQNTTFQGTDGQLQPLDTTKFLGAFQTNPTALQGIFQGAQSLTNVLGTYLTSLTGFPTVLSDGSVGNIPNTSVLQGFETANSNTINSLQDEIKRVTDSANLQADMLRQEFTASETQIAGLQALQSQLAGFVKGSGG